MGPTVFRLFTLAALSGVLATAASAQRQLAYDVKTPTESKYELQIAKRGILVAFEAAPTARVVETGEDYALWLNNVERFVRGDSMQVVAHIELREPSLLTRGRLITSLTPSFSYHRARVEQYANANVSSAALATDGKDYSAVAEHIAVMLTHASGPANVASSVSSALVAGAVVGLAEALRRNPSPVEVMESLYIGRVVLSAVEANVRR